MSEIIPTTPSASTSLQQKYWQFTYANKGIFLQRIGTSETKTTISNGKDYELKTSLKIGIMFQSQYGLDGAVDVMLAKLKSTTYQIRIRAFNGYINQELLDVNDVIVDTLQIQCSITSEIFTVCAQSQNGVLYLQINGRIYSKQSINIGNIQMNGGSIYLSQLLQQSSPAGRFTIFRISVSQALPSGDYSSQQQWVDDNVRNFLDLFCSCVSTDLTNSYGQSSPGPQFDYILDQGLVSMASPTNYKCLGSIPSQMNSQWPQSLNISGYQWWEVKSTQTIMGGVFLSQGTSFVLSSQDTQISYRKAAIIDTITMLGFGAVGTLTLGTRNLGLSSILSAQTPTGNYLTYTNITTPQKAFYTAGNLKPDYVRWESGSWNIAFTYNVTWKSI